MSKTIKQKRLAVFKSNKRGYYSLIIFSFLFIITLFSEFIANDKPLLISYKNEFYTPVFKVYTEKQFGGFFETEADYKDKFVQDLINKDGYIIWPLIRYSYDTIKTNSTTSFPSSPSSENLLGTDDQGRDVLARVMYGFRISILFGLTLTILSSIIGVIIGALQGYYGGKVDLLGQRFIEIWSGLPTLFLLIILANYIQPTFWWLLGLLLLFSWTALVGLVRAEFLRARNFEYVKAAKALGQSDKLIIFKHILPNAVIATITFMPFILSGSITTLTSLDFLGFGLPAGSPSLGELLAQGKDNLQAPWLGITAFVVLSLLLTLLIFIGEAFRDAMDPRIAEK
ncbi:ABC transporter permease [Arcobacter sp. CECT 8985]|uniref:ABC transporter permease n=1 Tax=Arcobacter sp. CECT 8985 TaxID=1935424 RepID=UPI002159D88A|nr:ABC transporter permease [Arcobacter sp. CECT 8985]